MINEYEQKMLSFVQKEMTQDAAHDINHVLRVVKSAKQLCQSEQAVAEIVVPAAYLHDCVSLAKNHPQRNQSSVMAAEKAIAFLKKIDYPEKWFDGIYHAIAAHSFSAGIKPETPEACIVQDADRLDALGAIGITRWMQVTTQLGTPLYHPHDAFCDNREPDDKQYAVDHFYVKLLRLADTFNTQSAKTEAEKRTRFMLSFLDQLRAEV